MNFSLSYLEYFLWDKEERRNYDVNVFLKIFIAIF